MDLNEKIAARRKEITAKAEAAEAKEKQAVDAEVKKRLQTLGIDQENTPVVADEIKVDEAVDEALKKAANARKTSGERTTETILLILGVLGFFGAWWLGLLLIAAWYAYSEGVTESYKKQILAEGEKRLSSES